MSHCPSNPLLRFNGIITAVRLLTRNCSPKIRLYRLGSSMKTWLKLISGQMRRRNRSGCRCKLRLIDPLIRRSVILFALESKVTYGQMADVSSVLLFAVSL